MEHSSLSLGFLASHNGSSMQFIHGAIQNRELNAEIKMVISNNSKSPALEFARENNIRAEHISARTHENPDQAIAEVMMEEGVNYIVFSGWMKVAGSDLVVPYHERILNAHPGDPKKYGGLYGDQIHQAVLDAGETHTYPTIHMVDLGVDTGRILSQGVVAILPDDTVETLRTRVKSEEGRLVLGTLQDLVSTT